MNHPDLYLSGAVRRWHTHPIMSRFGQTNAEHQWGALMLLLILHPNPDRALMLAVATHDIGERKVGDVPYPAKQDDPALAALLHAVEDRERQRLLGRGLTLWERHMTDQDWQWVRLCDRLEAWLHVGLLAPHILTAGRWPEFKRDTLDLAMVLGCREAVKEMMG